MVLFREILKSELQARQKRNPRYSLRSYARDLRLDAGLLSKLLSGKRLPSAKRALELARGLGLSASETRAFVKSVIEEKETGALGAEPSPKALREARELDLLAFEVVQNPHHYAILELTFADDFRSEVAWIAKRLGLTNAEVREAIRRLRKVGLLEEVEGRWRKVDALITTKDKHLTTRALQDRFERVLSSARRAMREQPVERRDCSTMTMCIDPAKLVFAKQKIAEFTAALCAELESGARKEVYELAIALFPVG